MVTIRIWGRNIYRSATGSGSPDNGVVASVGSKGDSFDHAMIESFNGLYKWELIYPHGPWQGDEDVEFATLECVDWFNHRRRHGEILPGRRQFTTPRHTKPLTVRTSQPDRL
ncbi:MAG TPA: integrase core domain-containing protein [Acidimicrobiia bacterium]|nr:integrase core domain-containing protein [Acidimicrobiia bacterium]